MAKKPTKKRKTKPEPQADVEPTPPTKPPQFSPQRQRLKPTIAPKPTPPTIARKPPIAIKP